MSDNDLFGIPLSSDDSAAPEKSSVSKAGAGKLYHFLASNINSITDLWLQFHNAAAVPSVGAVPVISLPIRAGGFIGDDFPRGKFFSIGITWVSSTTAATYTAPATNDILASVEFL